MSDNDINGQIDLTGQVAIVTCGGRGIGQAMALALARVGAAVAVVARTEDQLAETVALIEGEGGRAIAIATDVTDRQTVEQMVRVLCLQLGHNNADCSLKIAEKVSNLRGSLQVYPEIVPEPPPKRPPVVKWI